MRMSSDQVAKPAALLGAETVREIIGSIPDMRDKLMVCVLYETGCTMRDLVSITVSSIQGCGIHFSTASSGGRFSYISKKLHDELLSYCIGNDIPASSCIFRTRQSGQISERRAAQLITGYAEKAGYPGFNPHSLRNLHVVHAYENGIYQEDIAAQVGIKKFRVFQIIEKMGIRLPSNGYDRFLGEM
jgi:site-specific recombinase XerD